MQMEGNLDDKSYIKQKAIKVGCVVGQEVHDSRSKKKGQNRGGEKPGIYKHFGIKLDRSD